LKHVVRHIKHIGELIGYDHVGIGTDYDGIESTPSGLEDVSKFPDLIAELLREGISDEDAAKIAGKNILRVWKEADAVAKKLQKHMHPLEDDISNPWI
jgi:membrane dipeptidase